MSFRKIIHFIQYNNLTVFIVLAIFLASAGVFAQTPTGQDLIGVQAKKVEGIDNTLLLQADLDNFNQDYKIEKIEEDNNYYYVTYTYLDLVRDENAWQYQIQEKIKKVSKKLKKDLGVFLAEQFLQEYQAKIKDLRDAKAKAEETGSEKRVEVVVYTGLIGQTLDLVSKVFPTYQPIKKYEVPSPTVPPTVLQLADDKEAGTTATADNLTNVYNDYVKENDPDSDNIFGSLDNCPSIFNPDQKDSDNDGSGDVCDTENNPVASSTNATTTLPSDEASSSRPTDTSSLPATDNSSQIDPGRGSSSDAENNVQVIELPTE